MAERKEGVAVPDQKQRQNQQNQQQNQDPARQQQHLHINWSHFKPEFSGKPDEDADAHLLHSNDWILCQWCKSSKILSYIIRRGKIMVSISRTYKCRLARIAKFI